MGFDPTAGWGRWVADAVTGGANEISRGGAKYYAGTAQRQKDALNNAGDASAKLGSDQRDWYTDQGKNAISFYGGQPTYSYDNVAPPAAGSGVSGAIDYAKRVAATKHQVAPTVDPYAAPTADAALKSLADNKPTQQQGYYDYMTGQAAGKTNQETLYNERKTGTDPAAQYEDDRAVRALNTQLAARGGYNSSRGMGHISDYYANVGAQRSHDLANLASGADSSRLGLDAAYGGAASGASGEQRDYYNDVSKGALDLSKAKADTFSHFADKGGDAFTQGQLALIQAKFKAAGVDDATIRQLFSDAGSVVKGASAL